MTKKKSDLIPRLITAIVAVPLLIGIIFFAPLWAFFMLIVLAAGVSIWEYCSITYGNELPAARWLAVVLGMTISVTMYVKPEFLLEVLGGTTLVLMLFFLFFHREQERVSHQLGASLTAILYGGILFSTLALLNRDAGESTGPFWILMVLTVVWMSDTGAYFSGLKFGKHKLYPTVSPNKSIEGAVGGLIASVLAGFLCNEIFQSFVDSWQTLSWSTILLLTVPANLLGQMGDLTESLIKRCHKVKDSGTIIYGHGGILDRIDAVIFAAPWFYYIYSHVIQ